MLQIVLNVIRTVPVEPVERFRQNRQGDHIIGSPPLWLDQSNKELWLAVEQPVTGGLSGNLRRKVCKDILNLSKESKSFVVAGRRFHSCAALT